MISITFDLQNIDEAHFVTGLVRDGVQKLRAAQANATPEPVREEGQQEQTAPAASAPTVAPFAEPLVAKRGRGRPPKNAAPTPASQAVENPSALAPAAAPEFAESSAPAEADKAQPSGQQERPAADPVNIFAAPVAAPSPVAPVTPPVQQAPAAANLLKPEQRQALLKSIYDMPAGKDGVGGPEKAMALCQRFGTPRFKDLKAESFPEFDRLAAMTLAGTYNPVAGG